MNDSQTIFSIFYAVFYGSMLSSLGSLKAFPWGFNDAIKFKRKVKLFIRLVFSIFIFNILPFVVFAWGFLSLDLFNNSSLNFWVILISAIPSLAVFCPYRFFLLLLAVKPTLIYDKDEWRKIKKIRTFRSSKLGHFIGMTIYALPLIILTFA